MKFERTANSTAIIDNILAERKDLILLDLLRTNDTSLSVAQLGMKLEKHFKISDAQLYDRLELLKRLNWVTDTISTVHINGQSIQRRVWTLSPALREAMTKKESQS